MIDYRTMASGCSSNSSVTEELKESLLQCALCLDVFTTPRLLPCVHTFCHQCLAKVHQNDIQKGFQHADTLQCPTCRTVHPLPAEGIARFPIDHRMNFLKDVLNKNLNQDKQPELRTSPSENADRVCSYCKLLGCHTPATSFCLTCCRAMCIACCCKHDKKSETHALVHLDTNISSLMCQAHNNNFVVTYCTDCQRPLCDVCSLKDPEHHQHNGFVKEKSPSVEEHVLKTNINSTRDKLESMNSSLSEAFVSNAKDHDLCVAAIKERVEKLIKEITTKEIVLLKQTEDHRLKVEKRLHEIQRTVEKAIEELNNLDIDIQKRIHPIDGFKNITHGGGISFEHVTQVNNINVRVESSIPHTDITFKPLEFPHVGETSVSFTDSPCNATPIHIKNSAQFTCIVDACVFETKSEHSIVFIYGESHSARKHVQVYDGDSVQLWTDVLKITDVNRVATHVQLRVTRVAVLQAEEFQIVLNGTDNHVQKVLNLDENFSPRALTLTRSGHVIVATRDGSGDNITTTLACYSTGDKPKELWRKIISPGTKPVGVYLPEHITTDLKGRILVSDFWGSQVHIYSELGDYILSFPNGTSSSSTVRPSGICVDQSNRILVAFRNPHNAVWMFDESGLFVKQMVNTPEDPWAICLTGNDKQLVVGTRNKGIYLYRYNA